MKRPSADQFPLVAAMMKMKCAASALHLDVQPSHWIGGVGIGIIKRNAPIFPDGSQLWRMNSREADPRDAQEMILARQGFKMTVKACKRMRDVRGDPVRYPAALEATLRALALEWKTATGDDLFPTIPADMAHDYAKAAKGHRAHAAKGAKSAAGEAIQAEMAFHWYAKAYDKMTGGELASRLNGMFKCKFSEVQIVQWRKRLKLSSSRPYGPRSRVES